jgi:hypothetical protein
MNVPVLIAGVKVKLRKPPPKPPQPPPNNSPRDEDEDTAVGLYRLESS